MSTRSTISVSDDHSRFDIYRHHDGYPDGPHGVVRDLCVAQNLAWSLPRYEAAEFAAAVVAVMKQGPGSVYMAQKAEQHSDREYHYQISQNVDDVSAGVKLVISARRWDLGSGLREVFSGPLDQARENYCPADQLPEPCREGLILSEAKSSLLRAQDEITSLCGERPDEDTMKVHEQIARAVAQLSQFETMLETANPWDLLTKLPENKRPPGANWALKSRDRFQR